MTNSLILSIGGLPLENFPTNVNLNGSASFWISSVEKWIAGAPLWNDGCLGAIVGIEAEVPIATSRNDLWGRVVAPGFSRIDGGGTTVAVEMGWVRGLVTVNGGKWSGREVV